MSHWMEYLNSIGQRELQPVSVGVENICGLPHWDNARCLQEQETTSLSPAWHHAWVGMLGQDTSASPVAPSRSPMRMVLGSICFNPCMLSCLSTLILSKHLLKLLSWVDSDGVCSAESPLIWARIGLDLFQDYQISRLWYANLVVIDDAQILLQNNKVLIRSLR